MQFECKARRVKVGNGTGLGIYNLGSSILHTSGRPLSLHNVLHVPLITKNLKSVAQLTRENNVFVEFHSTHCVIKEKVTSQPLLHVPFTHGLYHLCSSPSVTSQPAFFLG